MFRIDFNRLSPLVYFGRSVLIKFQALLVVALYLNSCGKAYFPIELKTVDRKERGEAQEVISVKLVPMTKINIGKANLVEYKRRVIDAGDLTKPAKLIPASLVFDEKFPENLDPGPYIIGVGDSFKITQFSDQEGRRNLVSRTLFVNEKGTVNLIEFGRIKVDGFTQSELEETIYRKFIQNGLLPNFEIELTGFNSKRVFVSSDGTPPRTIPYTNVPLFLDDVLSIIQIANDQGSDAKITIYRGNEEYSVSLSKVVRDSSKKIRLYPDDKIYVSPINFRKETVVVVGETGAQRSIEISSFGRPSLSDAIFGTSALNNVTSDFSQIYVIRKQKKEFIAYHLDITNPSRISLATAFEMRPDDIVFVAAQPLSLYSRTLSQILGSSDLTFQARDTIRAEIGN